VQRCPFCGGNYVLKSHGIRCLMCDRTPNIAYEVYVIMEKNKEHRDLHVYRSDPRRKWYAKYSAL